MHSKAKAMLPVSNIPEILQIYRGYMDTWPVLEAIALVDTHWNISKFWNEFLIFDNFPVSFRTIFKYNVSEKLYICLQTYKWY